MESVCGKNDARFDAKGDMKKHFFASTVFVAFVIALGYFAVLPTSPWFGVFVFFVATVCAVRFPRETFGLFLASVVLEIFPIAEIAGVSMHWYQLLGGALGMTIVWQMFREKKRFFDFFKKLGIVDGAVGLVGFGGIVSAVAYGGVAPKQCVILGSCIAFYFLIRYFVRVRRDGVFFAPYLGGAFFTVMLYGIAQNILFAADKFSLEVMPGRPNGTFSEADWFGLYAALGVLVSAVAVFFKELPSQKKAGVTAARFFPHAVLFLATTGLLLSVARSAWLAAFAGLVVVKAGIFFRYGFRETLRWGVQIGIVLVLSGIFVFEAGLTSFELGNRAQSTLSGWQEITVVCPREQEEKIPRYIERVEEIKQNGCGMIMLEDVDEYRNRGFAVVKIFRKDPNAEIRKNVWKTSLEEIVKHPVTGIGWGNIGSLLGTDERGATLSSSNLFLEMWLGSGIFGFVGCMVVFGYLFAKNAHDVWRAKCETKKKNLYGNTDNVFPIGIMGLLIALVVFNLFNSAHFLAILWVVLALATTGISYQGRRSVL